eukprot:gene4414-14541_t
MACKGAKKLSLMASVRECFFGFADGADEKTFVKLQVQLRMRLCIVCFAAAFARSVQLILTSQWQWVEPSVVVFAVTRLFIIKMWIMCDPASLPSVVHRLDGPFSSLGSWCGFSVMIGAFNYLFTVRAKFGLAQVLMWSVLAPCISQRSPADLPPWIPVVTLAIATLARLRAELQARSQFKEHYYPTTDCTATTKTTNSTATTETTKTPGTTDSTETIETTKTTDSTETEPPGPGPPMHCLLMFAIHVASRPSLAVSCFRCCFAAFMLPACLSYVLLLLPSFPLAASLCVVILSPRPDRCVSLAVKLPIGGISVPGLSVALAAKLPIGVITV